MLDEKALRRPTWREGVEVVLADGQPWTLPLPAVRYAPSGDPHGVARRYRLGDQTGDYGTLVDAYSTAEQGMPLATAEAALAAALLTTNYDVTAGQAGQLVQLGYEDDDVEGRRIRREVVSVALRLDLFLAPGTH